MSDWAESPWCPQCKAPMEHDGDSMWFADVFICEDPECETLVLRPKKNAGGIWPDQVRVAAYSDF